MTNIWELSIFFPSLCQLKNGLALPHSDFSFPFSFEESSFRVLCTATGWRYSWGTAQRHLGQWRVGVTFSACSASQDVPVPLVPCLSYLHRSPTELAFVIHGWENRSLGKTRDVKGTERECLLLGKEVCMVVCGRTDQRSCGWVRKDTRKNCDFKKHCSNKKPKLL